MKFVIKLLLLSLINLSSYAQVKLTKGVELANKAQSALLQQLTKHHYEGIELSIRTIPGDTVVSLTELEVQIQDRYPPLKSTCVRLIGAKRSIPIWFTVKAYQNVLLAKRELRKRSSLNKADFIVKKTNIAGLRYKPYRKLPSGTWLNRDLKKNTLLSEDYISLLPQVIKGHKTEIKLSSQGVTLRTEGISQQDGYLGQSIKVKTTNKTVLTAVVTAAHQTEVQA